MQMYEMLRHFADSWVLLALTGVFLSVIVFAFRPGSRPLHDEAATVIFRHEDAPAKGEGKP
jgi:cytochrome c oxidase cbb3-type subunit IV